MNDSAAEFPIEQRAFVSDLRALRKRQSTFPFATTPLDFMETCMIGEVLDVPERFWQYQAPLREMYVHPTRTFVEFLKETGWDTRTTPTYDQLRSALAKAADFNRSSGGSSGGLVVSDL